MLLNGEWQLKFQKSGEMPEIIPATVPGCVHTDFRESGLIDDMFYRDNAKSIDWIENLNVVYFKKFTVEKTYGNEYIRFCGLDVYCDIYLNGKKIGSADDMFIPYEFSVKDVLKTGENTVEVRFRSPVKEVEGKPELEGAFTRERLYTRREQCTYGWDWVARFLTMGICGDVSLERDMPNEIDNVYIYTKEVNNYCASVLVEATFKNIIRNTPVNFRIIDSNENTVFEQNRILFDEKIKFIADIKNAELWYPVGYGEQPIYKLAVSAGNTEKVTNFGIRTVCIAEIEDEENSKYKDTAKKIKKYKHNEKSDQNIKTSGFWLIVNGIRIFCQGGNWVPCEPFVSEETEDKIRNLLETAKLCGYNMLRVWGGGVFEKDFFYDECDRLGIMVTQDFLMACGCYPESDDGFISKIKEEVKFAALKLRNHPCLVWWTGDNENATLGYLNKENYTGKTVIHNGIEPVLERYDPQRRFLLSSPYGGVPFMSSTCGTTHNTCFLGDIFEFAKSENSANYVAEFNKYLCRFCAEHPVFGMSFISSLEKFMTKEDIFNDNEEIMEYHCQNNPCLEETLFLYLKYMAKGFFGEFTDKKDEIYKLQFLGYELTRISFELYRREQWFSSGIIYWMFNDCWPTSIGWSMVDYYGNPKPAFYAFRRCAKPVISSISEEDGKIKVYICVNGLNDVSVKGRFYLYNVISGEETTIKDFDGLFPVGSSVVFSAEREKIRGIDLSQNVLLCDTESEINADRSVFYQNTYSAVPFEKDYIIKTENDNGSITVSSNKTVPSVMLDSEEILSDNCFFIKKNERILLKCIKGEMNYGKNY